MSLPAEVARSLHASWRLALFDADAYRGFDLSFDGFVRSFLAIPIAAPLYVYVADASARIYAPHDPNPTGVLGSLVLLVVLWLVWPLAMVPVSRWLGLSRNYVRYIVAYNWTSVPVIAALVPPLALVQLGVMGPAAAGPLALIALGWSLVYRWYVARTGLDTSAPVATALVLADLVLSLGLGQLLGQ